MAASKRQMKKGMVFGDAAIAVTSAMAMICGMSACAKKTIDYEAAEKEFLEYMEEEKYFYSAVDGRYDVTGDGY